MAQFQYANRHFEPIATPVRGDLSTISRRCYSRRIGDYKDCKEHYNYEEFYDAAATVGGSKSDLFFCAEDGCLYLPCTHELFRYDPPSD